MRLILAAFAAAGLAACTSAPTTVYAPISTTTSGTGYEDIRIENDRWRVSFTGAGAVSEAEVERLALRRAGQVALQNGYEWFEVVDRRFSQQGSDRSPVRVGGSVGRSWGSGGFSGTGLGLGISLSPGQQARRTVSLEIIAGSGDPQPDRAYDAAQVSRLPPGPPR
jgi:hypothetical protein